MGRSVSATVPRRPHCGTRPSPGAVVRRRLTAAVSLLALVAGLLGIGTRPAGAATTTWSGSLTDAVARLAVATEDRTG